jgi:hypothetical protein
MSPKIVNGSFAAIFDNGDKILEDFARTFSRLRLEVKDSPGKSKEAKQGKSSLSPLPAVLLLSLFFDPEDGGNNSPKRRTFSEIDSLLHRRLHSSIIFSMYGNTCVSMK